MNFNPEAITAIVLFFTIHHEISTHNFSMRLQRRR
jgi:hypothetical protein